uniref:Uncharacterized protein n=1 Tax=Romanomermis culicivorax TaxID=13658 RepID=A0A915KH97_ROMCU
MPIISLIILLISDVIASPLITRNICRLRIKEKVFWPKGCLPAKVLVQECRGGCSSSTFLDMPDVIRVQDEVEEEENLVYRQKSRGSCCRSIGEMEKVRMFISNKKDFKQKKQKTKPKTKNKGT